MVVVGIHVVTTPLIVAAVWGIVYHKKKNRSRVLPIVVASFIFNAANVYFIAYGQNIPWWIYAIVGTTTLISSYYTIKKVRKKLRTV